MYDMKPNGRVIHERIAVVMQTQYGIRVDRISEQAGGWAALAFRVDEGEVTYFLKMYDKKRTSAAKWTAHIHLYVPILEWLGKQPSLQGRLPVPLLTKDGNWKCEDEQAVYLLYEYIAGNTIGDDLLDNEQVGQLSHLISNLHLYGEPIPFDCTAMREDFQVPFLVHIRGVLNQRIMMDANRVSSIMDVIQPKRQNIDALIDKLEHLSSTLIFRKEDFVLCHTDIHCWNLMLSENRLILIDWEGLRLAPREADLMFMIDQPYHDHFINIYRRYHSSFEINADIMQFYRIRRKLEDIWEFIEQFLLDDQNPQLAEKTMGSLRRELLDIEDLLLDEVKW